MERYTFCPPLADLFLAKLSGIALNLLSLQEKTAVYFKPCLILSTAKWSGILFALRLLTNSYTAKLSGVLFALNLLLYKKKQRYTLNPV